MTRKPLIPVLLLTVTCTVSAQVGSDRLVNAAREARTWLTYSGG